MIFEYCFLFAVLFMFVGLVLTVSSPGAAEDNEGKFVMEAGILLVASVTRKKHQMSIKVAQK